MRNPVQRGMDCIIAMCMAVVSFIMLFVLFPFVLESAHTANQTTNITEYTAASDMIHLMPTIAFAIFVFMIIASVYYVVNPEPFREGYRHAKEWWGSQRFD